MSGTTYRRALLGVGTILIFSGFGYLMWGGIGENLVYFLTPSELEAKGSDVYDVPVRLGGEVAPGTVAWNAEALDLRFELTDGEARYSVRSTGAPPQMFREGIGVIVEGKLRPDGVFESSNLMVKHSNEYRPPDEGQRPREIYGELIRDAEK